MADRGQHLTHPRDYRPYFAAVLALGIMFPNVAAECRLPISNTGKKT